jgi:hypothetical protein
MNRSALIREALQEHLKRLRVLTVLVVSVTICAAVLSAGLITLRRRQLTIASGSREMRIVAISGERLATPFDGLSQKSKYVEVPLRGGRGNRAPR